MYLPTYPVCLSVYLSVCLSVGLSVCLSISVCISLSIYLSVYLSVYLSIYLSVYLSFYLSIFLSVCLFIFRVLSFSYWSILGFQIRYRSSYQVLSWVLVGGPLKFWKHPLSITQPQWIWSFWGKNRNHLTQFVSWFATVNILHHPGVTFPTTKPLSRNWFKYDWLNFKPPLPYTKTSIDPQNHSVLNESSLPISISRQDKTVSFWIVSIINHCYALATPPTVKEMTNSVRWFTYLKGVGLVETRNEFCVFYGFHDPLKMYWLVGRHHELLK